MYSFLQVQGKIIQEVTMLNCYRILDLSDEKGFLCGKILGDLGADVIKVEKPGGDISRFIGPYYQDISDKERSLPWLAFNGSKRGITLNYEDPEGREIFLKLCENADIVIETFKPGYLNSIGIGYSELTKRNPRLIMTSITPFGQSGPYKDQEISDIGIMAMSGLAMLGGYSDRPPVRMCFDQSYYLASTQAAAGTLVALYYRGFSGTGQHIDVSIYECAIRANYNEPIMWEFTKTFATRNGNIAVLGGIPRKSVWPCKDGYVSWVCLPENPKGPRAFVEWLTEEGQAGRWANLDWDNTTWNQELITDLEETIGKFILNRSQEELTKESLKRGLFIAPLNDISSVVVDKQLLFRNAWKKMYHWKFQTDILYPRSIYHTNTGYNEIRCHAPHVGEHNDEIYGKELKIPEDIRKSLAEKGII